MAQFITLLMYFLLCAGAAMLMGWLLLLERWTPDGKRDEASRGFGMLVMAMAFIIGLTF